LVVIGAPQSCIECPSMSAFMIQVDRAVSPASG
jgi:hypothetical protein